MELDHSRNALYAEWLTCATVFVYGFSSFVSVIGSIYWSQDLPIQTSDLLVGFAVYFVGTFVSTFGRKTDVSQFFTLRAQLAGSVIGYALLAISSTFSMWILSSLIVGVSTPMYTAYVLHLMIGQSSSTTTMTYESEELSLQAKVRMARRTSTALGIMFTVSALASLLILVERFSKSPDAVFLFFSSLYACLFCVSFVVSSLDGHSRFLLSLPSSAADAVARRQDAEGLLYTDIGLTSVVTALRNVSLVGEIAAMFTRTSLLTHSVWGVITLHLVERNEQLVYHGVIFTIDLVLSIYKGLSHAAYRVPPCGPDKESVSLLVENVINKAFDRAFVLIVLSASLVLCHVFDTGVYQVATSVTIGLALLSMHPDRCLYQDVVYTTQLECYMGVVPFAYRWAVAYMASQMLAVCLAVVVVYATNHTPLIFLAAANGCVYVLQKCVRAFFV